MYQAILFEKNNYLTLLFWVLLGIFTGPLVYAAVPVHMLLIKKKGEWLWLLLGFWLVLTLSDSRQGMFRFAQDLKTILILVLSYLYLTFPIEDKRFRFIKPFIPFFVVAFIALLSNPSLLYSFQKTFSYVLLLLIIPGIVHLLLKYERDRFLFHLVMTGTLILGIGLTLRYVAPGIVIFGGERFSGLLGNPNGLGIFSFMFLSIFTYIQAFHKHLFSRQQTILIYAIIIASLIIGGSRGGLFSSALFVMGWWLIRREPILGFVAMAVIFASYQLVMANFVEIVISLNLQDYFRLETLESGSGRVVAADIAWKHINENYWFSKGFTFSETIMARYKDYFEQQGHQGNVHNSWLTMWMDTGLVGLILFGFGWLMNFIRVAKFTPMVWALLFGLALSISVESWLVASLNPFTIQLVIVLSMLGSAEFYVEQLPPNQEMVEA